jgi:hypothetical protein
MAWSVANIPVGCPAGVPWATDVPTGRMVRDMVDGTGVIFRKAGTGAAGRGTGPPAGFGRGGTRPLRRRGDFAA